MWEIQVALPGHGAALSTPVTACSSFTFPSNGNWYAATASVWDI